jgi:hypothetical protein
MLPARLVAVFAELGFPFRRRLTVALETLFRVFACYSMLVYPIAGVWLRSAMAGGAKILLMAGSAAIEPRVFYVQFVMFYPRRVIKWRLDLP